MVDAGVHSAAVLGGTFVEMWPGALLSPDHEGGRGPWSCYTLRCGGGFPQWVQQFPVFSFPLHGHCTGSRSVTSTLTDLQPVRSFPLSWPKLVFSEG